MFVFGQSAPGAQQHTQQHAVQLNVLEKVAKVLMAAGYAEH